MFKDEFRLFEDSLYSMSNESTVPDRAALLRQGIVSDCINVSFHISRGWLLNPPMINVYSSCLWRTSKYIYTQYRLSSCYDCEVDDCLSRFM